MGIRSKNRGIGNNKLQVTDNSWRSCVWYRWQCHYHWKFLYI